MTRLLVPFLCLLVVACSPHRPIEVNLPVEPPEHYLQQPAGAGEALPVERWWQRFDDSVLDSLMSEMLRRNLRLEQGFARLRQARASARIIRSSRFPVVDGEVEAGRSMQPTLGEDFTGETVQLSLAARFELDLWGKLAARSAAAVKTAEAGQEDLRALYVSLSAQLADAYYLAVEQRAQLALTEETIRSFEDTLKRVESRYRMGLVSAVDVYQARQSLAAARASRHLFEANLAAAEHAVAILAGRYPDDVSAGDVAVIPPTPAFFPAGLPAGLVGGRPDLRAALRRIEAADQTVAAAIAERFPAVNLLSSYGETRQDVTAGLIRGDFWSLLGSLAMPVFDAGRRRAEVDRTRAVLQETVAAYQQAVLEAFREVEDALAAGRATEQRITRLAETEAATDAALRLSLQNYLYGVTDYLPVLTAQRSHFDVQSRLLTARRQLISHRISLARSLGGSWMDEQIEHRLTPVHGEDDE